MKIIQAHKYYWWRDGASNYALYLSSLLEQRGHSVIPFAMKHENNLKSDYEKYFVSRMDLDNPASVGFLDKLKFAGKMFYSFEAQKNIKKLLHEEKVDIVHLHNIYHHISPSILPAIKKRGIPIVMTLHDYKLLSPNYTMFHHGAIHEEDARGWYLSCIKNKCMKDSRLQSTVVVAEMIFHHKIKKYYEKYVDKFIAPSEFIMKKCIEFGWNKNKFVHIPHPIDLSNFGVQEKDEGYVVYVGRLSYEKGIETLLSAAVETPDIEYKIIGSGPLEEVLKKKVKSNKIINVKFEGFQTGKNLLNFIQNARIVVVPSVWYENYPLSILEAKAMGKIVIGSEIGGIPELVPENMLVPSRHYKLLANKIKSWYDKSSFERKKVGMSLRHQVEDVNEPSKHVYEIEKLYNKLVS